MVWYKAPTKQLKKVKKADKVAKKKMAKKI